MLGLLWLIPILPFASFLVLAVIGPRLSNRIVAWIGAGSVGLSALLAILVAIQFISAPPPGNTFSQTLWTWFQVDGLSPRITLYLDSLSLVMMVVVAFVSFIIHVYSAEFMEDEEGYSRF